MSNSPNEYKIISQDQFDVYKTNLNRVRNERNNAIDENGRLKEQLERATTAMTKQLLRSKLSTIITKYIHKRELQAEHDKAIAKKQAENNTLKNFYQNTWLNNDKLQKSYRELKCANETLQAESKAIKEECDKAIAEKKKLQDKIDELQITLDEKNDVTLIEVVPRNLAIERHNSVLMQQTVNVEDDAKLKAELEQAKDEIAQLKDELAEVYAEVELLASEQEQLCQEHCQKIEALKKQHAEDIDRQLQQTARRVSDRFVNRAKSQKLANLLCNNFLKNLLKNWRDQVISPDMTPGEDNSASPDEDEWQQIPTLSELTKMLKKELIILTEKFGLPIGKVLDNGDEEMFTIKQLARRLYDHKLARKAACQSVLNK